MEEKILYITKNKKMGVLKYDSLSTWKNKLQIEWWCPVEVAIDVLMESEVLINEQ